MKVALLVAFFTVDLSCVAGAILNGASGTEAFREFGISEFPIEMPDDINSEKKDVEPKFTLAQPTSVADGEPNAKGAEGFYEGQDRSGGNDGYTARKGKDEMSADFAEKKPSVETGAEGDSRENKGRTDYRGPSDSRGTKERKADEDDHHLNCDTGEASESGHTHSGEADKHGAMDEKDIDGEIGVEKVDGTSEEKAVKNGGVSEDGTEVNNYDKNDDDTGVFGVNGKSDSHGNNSEDSSATDATEEDNDKNDNGFSGKAGEKELTEKRGLMGINGNGDGRDSKLDVANQSDKVDKSDGVGKNEGQGETAAKDAEGAKGSGSTIEEEHSHE